jgi:RNA polymerase sigma-70 factor (ECF subfamily)
MNQPLRLAETLPSPEALSFEEFFDREKAGLYGALCLVVHDRHEAEDLTQDAFVRVFERWDRVSSMGDPRGYLYRTAMNVFRSRYRRARIALRRSAGALPNDDSFAQVEARDATVRALASLSPRQRAAVVLTDLLGFRSDEAAKMLGIRASTVRMHASRAHAALKVTMSDE